MQAPKNSHLLFIEKSRASLARSQHDKAITYARYALNFSVNESEVSHSINQLSSVLYYQKSFEACIDIISKYQSYVTNVNVLDVLVARRRDAERCLHFFRILNSQNMSLASVADQIRNGSKKLTSLCLDASLFAFIGDSHVACFKSVCNSCVQVSPPLRDSQSRIVSSLNATKTDNIVFSFCGNSHAKYTFLDPALYQDSNLIAYDQEVYSDFAAAVSVYVASNYELLEKRKQLLENTRFWILLPPPPISNHSLSQKVSSYLQATELINSNSLHPLFRNQIREGLSLSPENERVKVWMLLCKALIGAAGCLGAEILFPPLETYNNSFLLHPQYSRDMTHANKDFAQSYFAS